MSKKHAPHRIAEDAWTFERARMLFCNRADARDAALLLIALMSRKRPPRDERERQRPTPAR